MALEEEKMNPFHTNLRCFVTSFVENVPVVLEKISEFSHCIFAISKLSPLENGCGPSFEFLLPKKALCQVWLKLAER